MTTDVCFCGNPIPPDGFTDLYCSAACQWEWTHRGYDRDPVPVRVDWRRVDTSGCRCATTGDGGQCRCTPAPTTWPDPPPEPTYRTGRVAPRPPDPAEAFQRELIRRRPFLGPAMDAAARDLQKQDRSGVFRRILNATRKANS